MYTPTFEAISESMRVSNEFGKDSRGIGCRMRRIDTAH